MTLTSCNLQKRFEEDDIAFVQVEIEDLFGRRRGIIYDKDYFIENYQKGLPFYLAIFTVYTDLKVGSKITNIPREDGLLHADLDTYLLLPYNTVSLLADFKYIDGTEIPYSPRSICKRQLQKLNRLGYNLRGSFEYEFFIIDPKTNKKAFYTPTISLDLSPQVREILYDIARETKKADLKLEKFHSEEADSMFEFVFKPSSGIQIADNAFRIRNTITDVIAKHGYKCEFVSRKFNQSLSGHLNLSIYDSNNNNAFIEMENETGLSEIGLNWIAGLQKHIPALMCFYTSGKNCFERISKGYLYDDFAFENRDSSFRVKNVDKSNVYIEHRIPGSSSNPYLTLAATLVAAMDGLKNNMKTNLKHRNKISTCFDDAYSEASKDSLFGQEFGSEFLSSYSALRQLEERSGPTKLSKNTFNFNCWSYNQLIPIMVFIFIYIMLNILIG